MSKPIYFYWIFTRCNMSQVFIDIYTSTFISRDRQNESCWYAQEEEETTITDTGRTLQNHWTTFTITTYWEQAGWRRGWSRRTMGSKDSEQAHQQASHVCQTTQDPMFAFITISISFIRCCLQEWMSHLISRVSRLVSIYNKWHIKHTTQYADLFTNILYKEW